MEDSKLAIHVQTAIKKRSPFKNIPYFICPFPYTQSTKK